MGYCFVSYFLKTLSIRTDTNRAAYFFTAQPYFTTIVVLRSVFPAEFNPRTVKGYVPIVVGVPVMAAVDAFNDNPGGRLPVRMEKVGAG